MSSVAFVRSSPATNPVPGWSIWGEPIPSFSSFFSRIKPRTTAPSHRQIIPIKILQIDILVLSFAGVSASGGWTSRRPQRTRRPPRPPSAPPPRPQQIDPRVVPTLALFSLLIIAVPRTYYISLHGHIKVETVPPFLFFPQPPAPLPLPPSPFPKSRCSFSGYAGTSTRSWTAFSRASIRMLPPHLPR